MVGGIAFLVGSLFATSDFLVSLLRVAAALHLVTGYLLSVSIRIVDTYKPWPATAVAAGEWRPVRTLRGTVLSYIFVLLLVVSFFWVVFWLAGT